MCPSPVDTFEKYALPSRHSELFGHFVSSLHTHCYYPFAQPAFLIVVYHFISPPIRTKMARGGMLARRMKRELELLRAGAAPGVSAWVADESRLDRLEGEIVGASNTPYADGVFRLDIHVPPEYPLKPPALRFVTKIFHPNIDTEGRICLDTLNMPPKGAWKPALNIATVLTSVQALMSTPNPDDGLMSDITDMFRRDPAQFERTAREWTLRYAIQGTDASTLANSVSVEESDDQVRKSNASTVNLSTHEEIDQRVIDPPPRSKMKRRNAHVHIEEGHPKDTAALSSKTKQKSSDAIGGSERSADAESRTKITERSLGVDVNEELLTGIASRNVPGSDIAKEHRDIADSLKVTSRSSEIIVSDSDNGEEDVHCAVQPTTARSFVTGLSKTSPKSLVRRSPKKKPPIVDDDVVEIVDVAPSNSKATALHHDADKARPAIAKENRPPARSNRLRKKRRRY